LEGNKLRQQETQEEDQNEVIHTSFIPSRYLYHHKTKILFALKRQRGKVAAEVGDTSKHIKNVLFLYPPHY